MENASWYNKHVMRYFFFCSDIIHFLLVFLSFYRARGVRHLPNFVAAWQTSNIMTFLSVFY